MAERTGIAWARSTRNLWAGCTKIGPGCDGCYAEAFQRWVQGKNAETGEAKNWGPGAPRIPYLEGAFKDLRRWNRKAGEEAAAGVTWKGLIGFWPAFLNTQSDFFDNEVPPAWRDESYPVIEAVTNLTIFLVTKRIGNVPKMVPERWMRDGFPQHVRLIITVVNREEAERDIPKLLALPCKNGISYEPALEAVDWSPWLERWRCRNCGRTGTRNTLATRKGLLECPTCLHRHAAVGLLKRAAIDWIIVGGESDQSGHKTRPFYASWARSTVRQCKRAGVAVFVKQMGSYVVDRNDAGFDGCDTGSWPLRPDGCDPEVEHDIHGYLEEYQGADCRIRLVDRAGADPAEWPEDLRVREAAPA